MKKSVQILFLLLAGLFIFSSAYSQKTKDGGSGYKFVSASGNFRITFPAQPTVSEPSKVPTAIGDIYMYSIMYESEDAAFMVAYSDYPKDKVAGADKSEMLQGAKNGFTNNLGITVDFEREITLSGHKGIYFKASGNDYFAVMKDFMVANRLYQVGILKAGAYPTEKEINEFINTFELINP